MSELAIPPRQVDISRSSNKTQKRPLSIIAEHDSDDCETTDCTKHSQCVAISGKSLSVNTLEPNQASIGRNAISPHIDQAEHPVCLTSASDQNGFSETSLAHLKPSLIGAQTSAHAAKSKRSTSSACRSETNSSFSELRSGYQSENRENKFPGDLCSNSKSEKPKFPRLIIPEGDHSRSKHYNQPVANIQNSVSTFCDKTHTNSLAHPNFSGDCQHLTRIRELADRPNFVPTLSPTPPSPSSSILNSKLAHRLWTHPSPTRTSPQTTVPVGQNYQQLSLTTNEGTTLVVSLSVSSSPDSADCCDNTTGRLFNDTNDNISLSQPHLNRPAVSAHPKFNSSKLSSYFSRRMSNESVGSLSESDLSDGDIGTDDSSHNYLSYFRRLKDTTDRLRLSTRRPSIMLWRQQYMECQGSSVGRSSQSGDASDDLLTIDRKQRIDMALDWLRNQLQEMRSQDQNLAKQLLAIRHDIHKLKLQRSTEEHQELIDDFHFELQELQEFSDVLDLPLPEYADNPLKHIGVTRLNISARRFSAC